jgi:hypothetical protein
MSPSVRYLVLSLLVVFFITLFLGLTLRDGIDWDGDFALYIMQARNIAEGTPYASTFYLQNPLNPMQPALYPPGLALLLAPVYLFWGVSYGAMKWVGLLSLAGWLLVVAQLGRQIVPRWLALAAIVLMGLNPYIWQLKNSIYAEFPFLLCIYAALLLANRLIQHDAEVPRSPWSTTDGWLAAGLVTSLTFACLTRSIGVLLFPAIFAALLYRTRRPLTVTGAALLVALAAIFLVQLVLPGDSGTYLGFFRGFGLWSIRVSLLVYVWSVGTMLQTEVIGADAIELVAILAFLALAMTGLVSKLRATGPTVHEIFLLGYAGFLVLYPLNEVRYSLPFWPLVMLYGLRGAWLLVQWETVLRWRPVLPAAIAAAVLCAFMAAYADLDFGPYRDSLTHPNSTELFRALERQVPEDGVILARKPTIIGLHTSRRASSWQRRFSGDEAFWEYASRVGARYLVQDLHHFGDGPAFNPDDSLDAFVARNRASLRLVFHNAWFNVYSFEPPERA